MPLTIPLIEHQIASWENANPPEIAADFAPNAVFISPGGRWIGPEAIRAAAEGFFSTVSEVRVEVKRIIQCGDRGVIEWLWSERRKSTGLYHIAEDAVVFVLEDGKIVYWREYFDPGQMDAGVDSAYP